MGSKNNIYTDDFKNEAVKMALSSELSMSQVAKNPGIQYKTLYSWAKKNMPQSMDVQDGKNKVQALEEEVKALKTKLKRTEMEREILKKASAYFASQKL